MVTAAAQVKPFITGKEIKSNRKPAGDTKICTVMPQELKHLAGSDSHSGTVWLGGGSHNGGGGKWLGCVLNQASHLVLFGSLSGAFILAHVDDTTFSYHLLQSQRYIALKLNT